MSSFFWWAVVLGVSGCLAWRAGRIWLDAGRRGFQLPQRLGLALVGMMSPSRYWWGARIAALSSDERADLLARETATLGQSRADSVRCPLCGAEILRAWRLDAAGRPAIAPGPVQCPRCDFRLDACRHCVHFLPGAPRANVYWGGDDWTFGRCGRYKTSQPVEQACSPEMARRLKTHGYEQINAPLSIVDSFVPPDFCAAFSPHRGRLRIGDVQWPDARRVALLRLLAPPPVSEAKSSKEIESDDAQWLL